MDGTLLGPNSCIWDIMSKIYQLQNLKIFSTFQGHKNPHGQNFWNLIFFFLSEKARL